MKAITITQKRGKPITPVTSYKGFDIVRAKNVHNPNYWQIEKDGAKYSSLAFASVKSAMNMLDRHLNNEKNS